VTIHGQPRSESFCLARVWPYFCVCAWGWLTYLVRFPVLEKHGRVLCAYQIEYLLCVSSDIFVFCGDSPRRLFCLRLASFFFCYFCCRSACHHSRYHCVGGKNNTWEPLPQALARDGVGIAQKFVRVLLSVSNSDERYDRDEG
jgi:hypothetical protein